MFDAVLKSNPLSERRLGAGAIVSVEKALEHEVQGEMVVSCILSLDGLVRECHVLRSLPFMDSAVVDALKKRRYKPALLQGKPVEVECPFRIRLQLTQ